MKINKLKAISIAVCCLISSLWSEAQSMDNQPDILESSLVHRNAHMQLSSQNEMDALEFESTPPRPINVVGSQSSWASYLISPVKTTLQMANEFISFAHNNPSKAMFIGLVSAYQITAVAADCACAGYETDGIHVVMRVVQNQSECVALCKEIIGHGFWSCVPVNQF
jgi:hypothetical protein